MGRGDTELGIARTSETPLPPFPPSLDFPTLLCLLTYYPRYPTGPTTPTPPLPRPLGRLAVDVGLWAKNDEPRHSSLNRVSLLRSTVVVLYS